MVTVQSLLWPGADDDRWCCGYEYLTEIFTLCISFHAPAFPFLNLYFSSLSVSICPSVCHLSVPPTVPCMSNFTAPSGTVLSPDYPEGYGNNMNCVWLIQSDPGSRIHLAFNDFDLEAPYDSLTVKDGETNDAVVIGRFSGAESPSHLTSNTNTLRLEFQADHSMSGRGFNITYSSMFLFFFILSKNDQFYLLWGKTEMWQYFIDKMLHMTKIWVEARVWYMVMAGKDNLGSYSFSFSAE